MTRNCLLVALVGQEILSYIFMITFGKMMTYFQLKKNNNTFIVSYIFNDKALVISSYLFGYNQAVVKSHWGVRSGVWAI